ncbi:hypothetical protein L3X38_040098 [Prunus dulcis]|uniref:Uncharacterized protein n=1 Tax=Prunus dulcis TaxID=3755 RepID=A0AAD4V8B8_PRUDU|nr:hypothetical protein L3X38_040098 [Prunus dulcis]
MTFTCGQKIEKWKSKKEKEVGLIELRQISTTRPYSLYQISQLFSPHHCSLDQAAGFRVSSFLFELRHHFSEWSLFVLVSMVLGI